MDRSPFDSNVNLNILADKFNYIQPDFITLFVTNHGQNTPHHVYRIFDVYYGKEQYRSILSKYKKA